VTFAGPLGDDVPCSSEMHPTKTYLFKPLCDVRRPGCFMECWSGDLGQLDLNLLQPITSGIDCARDPLPCNRFCNRLRRSYAGVGWSRLYWKQQISLYPKSEK
jgi:hypothetical protein